MKHQPRQTSPWQSLMTTALFMLIGASNAFADAGACINPTEVTLRGDVKMKFCDIPAAQGVMIGSTNGRSNERPVKPRNFKKFQMAQFEVTQLQYRALTGITPWKYHDNTVKKYVQEGNDNSAVYVNYYHVQKFAHILGLIDETATYRLPTEAEFEYAARAGSTTNYYWGDKIDDDFAYYWDNTKTTGRYARKVDSCPNPERDKKHPGYCANGFGLYHMLGNVSEWTSDSYVDSYANAHTDGNVAVQEGVGRVVRGGGWHSGSWGNSVNSLRPSNRGFNVIGDGYSDIGFRLVRIAK